MINVLHIMGSADVGGISAVVLNYYRHMDRERFHFDLVLHTPTPGRDGRIFQSMGSTVYYLPQKHTDFKGFSDGLKKILSEKHYDAIHVHHNDTSYVALRIAKQMGIPCRIAHSHSTIPVSCMKDELRRLSGCVLNPIYATQVIGCGQLAGERVFGKLNMKRSFAHVLPNAIDTQRFAFSSEYRGEVRKELGIGSKPAIGIVGRLSEQKNPLFALKVLNAVLEKIPDACLVYVGGGEMESEIREEIHRLGLKDKVILTGSRSDVERIYSAPDVMIMPSLYEGFPVAAVEAMASGLPIVLSDHITKEFSFGTAVRYLPIDDPVLWARAVEELMQLPGREQRQSEAREHGFDIHDTASMLESIYLKDISQ